MDRSRRRWLGKTGAALLLGGGLVGSRGALAQTARPAARTVILGQSVPLTGAASEIGLAFAAGCRLYATQYNEANETSGLQLKLLQLDDGYDPQRAAANARTLLVNDKADMLFGFVGTASSEAGANAAAQLGTVLFAPFAAINQAP